MFNFSSGSKRKSTLAGQVAKLKRRAAKKAKTESLRAEKSKLITYLQTGRKR